MTRKNKLERQRYNEMMRHRRATDPEWRELQLKLQRDHRRKECSAAVAKFLEANPHSTVDEIYAALPWLARKPVVAKNKIHQALCDLGVVSIATG